MTQRVVYADAEDVEDRLVDISAGLDIRFADDAFSKSETLGDICDVIWAHVRKNGKTGRCPTSASYYRIASLMRAQGLNQVLRPDVRLVDLKGFVYADLQSALRRKGWSSPIRSPRTMAWSLALVAATLGTRLTGLANDWAPGVWLGLFVATVSLAHIYVFRSGLPADCETLGDLARQVGFDNLRDLRTRGATGMNRTMIWQMLAQGVKTNGGPAVSSARLR